MEFSFTKLRVPVIVVLAFAFWLMPASNVAWGVTTASHTAQTEPHPEAPEAAKGHEGSKEAEAGSGHEAGEKSEKKEDPTEALTNSLRHSAAVKAIGRITGLDEEKAYWLSTVINFLIVVGVLWLMLGKMLPAVFRNRTESIQKRIEEARRTSEDARQRLSGVEERLSRLDAEIAQMRSEATAAGKADEERVMKAAEDERRRIVDAAQQEIATAAGAAQRELRAFVSGLAVDLAEKKITVARTADQSLVKEFTARLGKEQ